MNTTLQTEVAATEVVIGAPVFVMGEGKTSTDKKLSVLKHSSTPTLLIAATMAGKVGKAARDTMERLAPAMLARDILSGNYKSIAEALYLRLEEPVSFGSAAEAVPGETQSQFVQRQRDDFQMFGMLTRKAMAKLPQTTKSGKVAPKYARHIKALELYTEVLECIAAEKLRREEARMEREASAASHNA